MEIRTERLVLRELRESDLEGFHRLVSNPATTEFIKQSRSRTIAESQQLLDDLLVLVNMMRSYEVRGEPVLILAITAPPSKALIGTIGTFRPREIVFSLHPDYWGKGIALEAARGFCQWYTTRHRGQQLFAKLDLQNSRAVRCLQRCGFSAASANELKTDEAYGKHRDRETWLYRGG